ncbi:MAG: MnmC family methyltransferase [Candidatus Woesearchaeota archaeon]
MKEILKNNSHNTFIKPILTDDNSITYFNEKYQETYHSKTGAVEEALKKFVEPTNIKNLAMSGQFSILDVCFGLGYNTAVAIDIALKENPKCKIEVIALENDITILDEINKINPEINSYLLIKQLVNNKDYELNVNNIKIKLLLGDARKTIKKINPDILSPQKKFDVCFLDPFSPKKCPELWEESFFSEIHKIMGRNSILATYSCARIVRDNLKKAGFIVKDGPVVGRRAPGTIGVLY